jgi:hypothetical protein
VNAFSLDHLVWGGSSCLGWPVVQFLTVKFGLLLR